MGVRAELEKLGFRQAAVELGEVELKQQATKPQFKKLNTALKRLGFELLDAKKNQVVMYAIYR